MAVRLRIGLRAKLALLSLVLLVLPAMGYLFVQEMERFLLEAQRESVGATARAVATALHDRPELFGPSWGQDSSVAADLSMRPGEELFDFGFGRKPAGRRDGEVAAILKGLERSTSRIWVANRKLEVLARTGSLVAGAPPVSEPDAWLRRAWRRLLGLWLKPPQQDYIARVDGEPLTRGVDITSAFLGVPRVWVRGPGEGRPSIVAAAQPVWVGDQVLGAVVVEESTHSVLDLRNRAIERLTLLTLLGLLLTVGVLLAFASRLSWRIRRLRDEADGAIDASGRITGLSSASQAADEVGDLARSFTSLLSRLGRHHSYLESMASRLSHELRTPIAVVRSSLENMRHEKLEDSTRTYIERAEAGISRLSRILARMSEANRMEQSLATTEPERFDLAKVIGECVEGYRLMRPQCSFEAELPRYPVWVSGSPDLAAQMLDKLIENAADFATPGTPIRVGLAFEGATGASLSVANQGPPIPDEFAGQLFDSMVSGRKGEGGDQPHLGLGLYVARMIAGFHGGELSAENLPNGKGVRFRVGLRLC